MHDTRSDPKHSAGQLATELPHLFITGSPVANKSLRGFLPQLAAPPSQNS